MTEKYINLPNYFKKYIDINKSYNNDEINNLFNLKLEKTKFLYKLMSSSSYRLNSIPYLVNLQERINNHSIKIDKVFCPIYFENSPVNEKYIIISLRIVSLLYCLQNNMNKFSEELFHILKIKNYYLDEYIKNINIDEISYMWDQITKISKNIYDQHVGTACNFAIKLSRKYPIEYEDAIQICLMALDDALHTYNVDFQKTFLRRAFVFMKSYLNRSCKYNENMYGNDHRIWHMRIDKIYEDAQSRNLEKPTINELNHKLGLKQNKLNNVIKTYNQKVLDINELKIQNECSEISINKELDMSYFLKIIDSMNNLTKKIIFHQFSLNGFEQLSRRSLAKKYNISESIVRSHLKKGLDILKNHSKGLTLEDFLDERDI